MPKPDGDSHCLNCLHSNKNKLKSYKKICENKDFCDVTMPCGENMLLEFVQHLKSIKTPFLVSADLECLIKK